MGTNSGEDGKLEPLRLTNSSGDQGESQFLVMNDETGDPEMWSEKEVEQNRAFNAIIAAAGHQFVTYSLIALNLIMFAVTVSGGLLTPRTAMDVLLRWGADYGPLTIHGQWWRTLTATFLHLNVTHLLGNMFFLFLIGRFAERVFGRLAFASIYLLTGIAGSLASLSWYPAMLSVGASGAIFGIYGSVLGLVLLQPGYIPRPRVISIGKSAALFVVYQMAAGFFGNLTAGAGAHTDLAAHLGGCVCGFLLGGVFARAWAFDQPVKLLRITTLSVAVALLAFAAIATRLPQIDDFRGEMGRLAGIEKTTLKLFGDSLASVMSHKSTPAEFGKAIEEQVLPPWKNEQGRLANLKVSREQQPIANKVAQYVALRITAWTAWDMGAKTNDPKYFQQAMMAQRQVDEVARQINPNLNSRQNKKAAGSPMVPGRKNP